MGKKIGTNLKRFLWSLDHKKIEFEKAHVYIIHQVLSWGELEDLKSLFKIYGIKQVRDVFLRFPKKVYTYSCLKFVEGKS